jgi:hypothetical protein
MNLYISGIGWIAIFVIYIPVTLFVIGLIYILILKKLNISIKVLSVLALFIFSAWLLLWDIIQIGNQAKELCKNAGLHINKTVVADGFYGKGVAGFARTWKPYGFSYVEEQKLSGQYIRTSELNGEFIVEKNVELKSRYWSIQDDRILNKNFKQIKTYVKDSLTDEVLSELIYYKIYPGWFDSYMLSASGFSFSPWVCKPRDKDGGRLTILDLIQETIHPIKTKGLK